jgi:hypothetical protein
LIRPPSELELLHILKVNEARGVSGMIDDIYYMHWEWSSCPTPLCTGTRATKLGKPAMILEVVETKDLKLWHAYFGLAGSHNDINVL